MTWKILIAKEFFWSVVTSLIGRVQAEAFASLWNWWSLLQHTKSRPWRDCFFFCLFSITLILWPASVLIISRSFDAGENAWPWKFPQLQSAFAQTKRNIKAWSIKVWSRAIKHSKLPAKPRRYASLKLPPTNRVGSSAPKNTWPRKFLQILEWNVLWTKVVTNLEL